MGNRITTWAFGLCFCVGLIAAAYGQNRGTFPNGAGGSINQLQYNNVSALGGISGWTTNGTTTLVGAASTTLAIGGGTALATSNQTGAGSLVLQTSPTLTTPVLGAATATSLVATGDVSSRSLTATGQIGAFVANSISFDVAGGVTPRFMAFGPNTSTMGSLFLSLFSSDASAGVGIMSLTATMALSDAQVTVNGSTVASSKLTGSLVNKGGFGNAGAIYTDTLNVITMANTATTSAVCYNTGTGLFTYNGTVGTCTVSDGRLKDLKGPIDGALDRLLKINGVYFNFKDPAAYGAGRQIGVVAQEVEAVFPELVSTDAAGTKSVDYQKLVAPIIEAVRELKSDNNNLRACQKSWKCRIFGLAL